MKRTPPISRRRFLRISGGAVAAGAVPSLGLAVRLAAAAGGQRTGRSVVVEARSEHAVANANVRGEVLDELMSASFLRVSQAETVAKAWATILRPDEIVGLRLERQGDRVLGTAAPMARWLVRSLLQAGWPAERIVLLNGPTEVVDDLGVREAPFGWSTEPVDFGSGSDHLAAFVDHVDAIINVPFLKDDNIMGISGCLKSATYHLLKHPARYHHGGGAPMLGDILALPILQRKMRLHILNGLRTVFDGGPLVFSETIQDAGPIIMSTDPLAADLLGLEWLNTFRAMRELRGIELSIGDVPALMHAADRGLGHIDLHHIDKRLVVVR